jgi:hypothetical protein
MSVESADPSDADAESVYVIGAGIAGLAACARLQERGRRPVLLSSGVGATEMGCGAADFTPWTHSPCASDSNPEYGEVVGWSNGLLSALGCFVVTDPNAESARVVSFEGIVRPAFQVARGLLDLQALSHGTIGVWDLSRRDWRASALCACLMESSWRALQFVPLSLPDLVSDEECLLPLASFFRLFDQPERRLSLLAQLSGLSEKSGFLALLTGPWLGSSSEFFQVGMGLPMGETLSPPDGPFGVRFSRAREHWLSARQIECHNERVVTLKRIEGGVELHCILGTGERMFRRGRSCIVATGGLVGGGIALLDNASGSILGSPLDPAERSPSGALEGWDPQTDGGRWLWPPHQDWEAETNSETLFAGDVCGLSGGSSEPRGTILSACASGRWAADRL